MNTTQNTGINDDKAAESPPASSPKVAPTAGGVTVPGVSSSKKLKAYILYDGRAEVQDTDDCSVLEFVGHTKRDIKDALACWRDCDGVLVEYDDEGGKLVNERIIGHLREGKKLLALVSEAQS